ncbi:nucleolar complex protein 3 homolog [Cimex lectularius]|uniref:NOC3-like protein n=1 Tax=Cimex lectularius TaxID=79782 RepID=A0A8I6R918_CIMLE|nr:nucleolar complex protein 3 homolog [Cimex lectularius]
MAKAKTSKVKRTNKANTKLRRQGKLRHKRNKKTAVKSKHRPQPSAEEFMEDEEPPKDVGKEMASMIDPEDLEFLKDAVVRGSYSMFQGPNFNRERKLLKRKADNGTLDIETKFEMESEERDPNMRKKLLLPIKTKTGLIRREIEVEVKDVPEKAGRKKKKKGKVEEETTEEVKKEEEDDDNFEIERDEKDLSKPISVAEMLAWRESSIAQYKFKIGILASALLENPEQKVLNIQRLLEVYDDWHPELQITLKKLVMVSLLEVFKDILPSYQIKHQDNKESNVKLKKETRELQTFEKSLLKGYRGYLTKLEKAAAKLFKKKGDTRVRTKQELELGELGINALCELLTTHPYFNYSKNIVRLLVPYLDSKYPAVRSRISSAITNIFMHDKRGEITLEIVRRINDLVKTRKHAVRPDAITVLSYLKINDINLDDMKNAEMKEKKLQEKKKRIINLSKKEKKRQKRIAEIEKELLETKAEENKQQQKALLTEVIKLVFTIYFRILKSAPSSGLLSAALQGLAKFTHCINIEFYQDLVVVLHNLLANGNLNVKERLNSILTIFKILSGQGESLSIDPNKFYTHLYAIMLNVHLDNYKNENEQLLLQCLDLVILGRRKKLTFSRLLAFIKRLGTISLYQEHHVAIACLTIMRQMFQLNKGVDKLLEIDTSIGQGVYLPELQDPEYCNAVSTALYEMPLLSNHYHPTVRQISDHVVNLMPPTGKFSLAPEIVKLSSAEIYKDFDPSEMAFKPSIPMPKKKEVPKIKNATIKDKALAALCDKVLAKEIKADFSELLDKKPIKVKKEGKEDI